MYDKDAHVVPSSSLTAPHDRSDENKAKLAISVDDLSFGFGGPTSILDHLRLKLPRGCRALLVGANGAGKTTLLNILAGKRMVRPPVHILGKDPFSEMPEGVTYLGTEFVANAATRTDVSVTSLISSVSGDAHPERRDELLHCLDVDPTWRMHVISDGERRRVQILLGLVRPWNVLLLDEVTVDLDVLARRNLLRFLERETRTGGVDGKCRSVLYATHIFDGLGSWPTHVARISLGEILYVRTTGVPVASVPTDDALHCSPSRVEILEDFPEMVVARREAVEGNGVDSPLLLVVEKWLREDYERRSLQEDQEVRPGGRRNIRTRWDELKKMPLRGDRFDMYYNYWEGR